MHLFAGSSHPALAQALAKELGISLGKLTTKTFSCGEHYVKFDESVRGKDVYVLQTGTTNVNDDLMELMLICQAAKLSFAKTVHVILPHFPYERQDRVAEPREPISAKLVANLLETAGADHIMTLDLHSDQIQGFFHVPVDAIIARPLFAEYFTSLKIPSPTVVAPDIGAAKRAKKFADLLGAPLAIMHKSRPKHHEVEIREVVGEVAGRTCILFDDIIDTAGTLVSAKEALLQNGALPDVYAAATHGVLSGPAMERLKKAAFKEVIVTDSIPLTGDVSGIPFKVLPIAPLLAKVIQSIESGKSVTEIYEN
jgi:ribose-phosphate pyrophosphokinase